MRRKMSQNDIASEAVIRQIIVQRKNLVQIFRLSVKSLIDRSLTDDITDHSDEILNFVAVLEHVFMFQMKPQKAWYKTGDLHYWDYIMNACKKLSNNCIKNVESLEDVRSKPCKGRAWIRMALMEKRLSEYLSAAQANTDVTQQFYDAIIGSEEGAIVVAVSVGQFYEDDAIIGSEEGAMIVGLLVGLNTIDFSFCLKGCNADVDGPLVIDYSKYIDYPECAEEEFAVDTNTNAAVYIENPADQPVAPRTNVWETKYRNMTQQKEYLEELVRVRTADLEKVTADRECARTSLDQHTTESRQMTKQLETVVLELQQQLADVKEQNRRQQLEISLLRTRLRTASTNSDKIHDKMMQDMVTAEEILRPQIQSPTEPPEQKAQSSQTIPVSETASLTSDTTSLIPLTGSFTDPDSLSADLQMSSDLQMSLISSQTDNTIKSSKSHDVVKTCSESSQDIEDDFTSDQSSNGNFVVVMPQHIDGAVIEGEVEVLDEGGSIDVVHKLNSFDSDN